MCGRFACAVDPEVVCRACRYRGHDGAVQQPKWRDNPRVPHYNPSANVAPTNYSPVLVSRKNLKLAADDEGEPETSGNERVVIPMRFGLIPSWHRGEESGMHLSTTNCRWEGILEKKTFAKPLKKGRRCVVLCEGYYDWKKLEKSKTKQPYIIYTAEEKPFLQSENKDELLTKSAGKVPLLKLAAIFDVWRPSEGEPDVYGFSIITVAAAKSLIWIHDRMPAILLSEEEVSQWLDFEKVPAEDALNVIHPVEDLKWHPVTRAMGNAGYKNPDASKPIPLEEAEDKVKPLPKGQMTMASFLRAPGTKRSSTGADGQSSPLKLAKRE
ncbi:Embryonic stem cell-specific 5-hydroxymethylcytosine-binding protein [Hypsibius exemplaris]|uniref:Abasic site processing protein HMCES n=1 Tax=Hypsibius exemplaris TaxID=2072580 RepID=A0A9X6RL51_HYPEX|nr:Embryonic stem cell-specific 5-hydroxymethylcytosine-binding protein [Hypsibius exemplaris]